MSKTPNDILMRVQGIGNNQYIKRGQENIRWMLLGAGAGFVIASYYGSNKWIGLIAGSIVGGVGAELFQNYKPPSDGKTE